MSDPMPAHLERRLYDTDRAAWHDHVAERLARKLMAMNDANLNRSWSCLEPDTKAKVWAKLDQTERGRVRALRSDAREQCTHA